MLSVERTGSLCRKPVSGCYRTIRSITSRSKAFQILESSKEKKELQSQNNEFKQELTKKTHTIEPLFAKPIPNGYSLIDSAQKEVMVLYKTGKSDFYIVKGKDAIVYRRIKNIWLYLEANDENHSERPIVIEF